MTHASTAYSRPKSLRDFLALIRAGLVSSRREMVFFSRDRLARTLIMGGISVSFLAGVFTVTLLVFSILFAWSDRLAWDALVRVGEYGLGIVFFMMIYSAMLTSLHILYTDRTLALLWSSPIPWNALWWSRFIVVALRSSWMVGGFAVPVLFGLGVAAESPWWYYPAVPVVLLLFGLLPCSLGAAGAVCLVFLLPPKRLQQALLLLGLVVGMLAVVGFRLLRLERVIEGGDNMEILRTLAEMRQLPTPLAAPIRWASETLVQYAQGLLIPLGPLLALLLAGAVLLGALHLLGLFLYYPSWSHNQTSRDPAVAQRRKTPMALLARGLAGTRRPLFLKDFHIFFRDLQQWSALVMILPLVVLYVVNLKMIPLPMRDFASHVGWFNLIICGLIVIGIGARLLYPCFSMEGPAVWNLLTSPFSPGRWVMSKFIFYSIPLLSTSFLLTVTSNLLFSIRGWLLFLTFYTSLLATLTVCSIGIAFSAIFPRFEYRQVSQVILSMGGLYYMLAGFGYITLVSLLWLIPFIQQANPVGVPEFATLLRGLNPRPWLVSGTLVSLGVMGLSLWSARRALSRLEV